MARLSEQQVVHQMMLTWTGPSSRLLAIGQPIYLSHIGSRISLVLRRLHWLNAAMIHFQTVHLSFSREKRILFRLWTRKDHAEVYFIFSGLHLGFMWHKSTKLTYVEVYLGDVDYTLPYHNLYLVRISYRSNLIIIFIWLEFLIGQSLM
jgi:hypothetical protein